MKIAKKEVGLTLAGHYAKGMFPALYTRHEKFPGGESLDDVLGRAEAFVEEVVVPLVLRERDGRRMAEGKEDKEGGGGRLTVVVVSHGLFIAELVAAILKRDASLKTSGVDVKGLRGMKNTAWTRVEVVFKVCKNFSFFVFWLVSKREVGGQRTRIRFKLRHVSVSFGFETNHICYENYWDQQAHTFVQPSKPVNLPVSLKSGFCR